MWEESLGGLFSRAKAPSTQRGIRYLASTSAQISYHDADGSGSAGSMHGIDEEQNILILRCVHVRLKTHEGGMKVLCTMGLMKNIFLSQYLPYNVI